MGRASLIVCLALVACGGKLDTDGHIATRTIGTYEGPNGANNGADNGSTSASSGSDDVNVKPGAPLPNDTRCGGAVSASSASFEPGDSTDLNPAGVPGLTLDPANPITGTRSGRIDASVSGSYLKKFFPGVCATTVILSVRPSAEVVASGITLVRVDAKDRELLVVIDPGGGIHLAQQAKGGLSSAYQPGRIIAKLAANVVTRVSFGVDLSRSATTLATTPLDDSGTLGSDAQPFVTSVGETVDVEITEVDVGTAPPAPGQPLALSTGVYWLDDVSIQ